MGRKYFGKLVMRFNKIYLSFCIAAIALFFIGRCTAPKPEIVDNKHTIDSLNRRIAQSQKINQLHKEIALKAIKKAQESQKVKVVIRTVYIKDTARNHALKPMEKDSVIKAIFGRAQSDSSRFSKHIANGILDLKSESLMLKKASTLDSISLAAKDEGILELGQVINSLTDEGSAKDGIVIEERETNKKLKKEIRKQRRLKWLAVSGIFVVSTLAIISN